jgi:hypothetical protein
VLLHLALLLLVLLAVVALVMLWRHHAGELQFLGCCPCVLWPVAATMGE